MMGRTTSLLGALLVACAPALAGRQITQGTLTSLDGQGQPRGECPLKHTAVNAAVSGSLARVTVRQQFENPFHERIEAVYTFPLPQSAAVDDMTMLVGGRTIRAKIKRREEAEALYKEARAAGQRAALLNQERPNIFTQAVANILPGDQVTITISYVERLRYEERAYEFVFPMVVGPRYIPARVTDAARISPPVMPLEMRAGHDISIDVAIDAGVPIDRLESKSHEIRVERSGPGQAMVRLLKEAEIPNRDFILRYDVAGRAIQDALLAHRLERGGFFLLILQPPERVTLPEVTPKELVFVLDTSGSMSGFPIEKAKEAMRLALDGLYPHDTFNLMTFSGDTHILFPEPVPATAENLRRAREFLVSRSGSGGTEMMKAVRAALDPSRQREPVRIACFMTDGYVGNEMEIIAEVQKHPNARVFAFGIGQGVNRFLLDKMAEYGRGEVEYVSLSDDGSAAARRFHQRVREPLLTDISIDWGGLPAAGVYPMRVPDLFSARPVVVMGRYVAPASGVVHLRGRMAGREITREIRVTLPAFEPKHDVLATLWARARVDELMGQDLPGLATGAPREEVRREITQLGLDYRLMTQFTSFVAVEEKVVTQSGQPQRIEVPVEIPQGVSYEGVFGPRRFDAGGLMAPRIRIGGNVVGGVPGGVPGGVIGGIVTAPPPPPLPRQELSHKLHPSLLALVQQPAGPADRKVEVQVWLLDASAKTLDRLKGLGFELHSGPKANNVVAGRIPIARLAALAEVVAVRYVAPPQLDAPQARGSR